MRTNKKSVVMQSIQGCIHHPTMKNNGYWVGYDGKGRICVGTGGITYNYKIGDSCMDIPGDHVEPGVSLKNPDPSENTAVQALACIGNEATVISGDGKGRKGIVTGKHGGVDHVMIYFDEATLELLQVNDRIAIKAYGQGLSLLDYPDIHVMNIDPSLLEALAIKEEKDCLQIPVKAIVPSYLMGAGLGETTMMSGDYDIMTQDHEEIKKWKLDTLRFGDFVFIQDHDNFYGPHYRRGACSVGVVVHSDSYTSGHGPGVTIILSAHTNILKPVLDEHANLADILRITK